MEPDKTSMPEEMHTETAGHTSKRGWHGDPERHAEIGRRGGLKVSSDREHMAAIGRKGGAKVSQDRAHMSAIGRIGGSRIPQPAQNANS